MTMRINQQPIRFIQATETCNEKYRSLTTEAFAERLTRFFFYAGLVLVLLNRIIDQTAVNLNLDYLAVLPLMPVALLFLIVRFIGVSLGLNLKRFFISFVLLIFSFVSYYQCGQSYLPTACLLLCGIGGIDIRKTIKAISACTLLLIVGLGLIQLMDWALTGDLAGSVLRSNGRLRLSFYFEHPNILGAMALMSFMGFTVCSDNLSASDCLMGISVGFLILFLTDSRTSCALLFLYLLIRFLFDLYPQFINSKLRFVVLVFPLVCEFLSMLVMLQVLPDSFIVYLNRLFSGRPGYWILQYNQLGGWTMFGQVTLYGDQFINGWLYPSVTIDCFYAATLLQLGIWSFIAFYYLYVNSIDQAFMSNDHSKFAVLFVCAIFGFTEVHMIDFSICFPMLLLGEGLLQQLNSDDVVDF